MLDNLHLLGDLLMCGILVTSVYLKVGLMPCRELMERGISLSCRNSRLSSVNTSITFLMTSSPVEQIFDLEGG